MARRRMTQKELAAHEEELGFRPQRAVRWLAPRQLAVSGAQVAVAQAFADFADRREMQAGFDQGVIEADGAETDGELWVDFIADLGDGFDATYTMARLLAEPQLTPDGAPPLPKGSLLLMGGDEVYPTASARAYEDRTTGPYRAASVDVAPGEATLLALPGNHDWYDGLSAFLRIFARGANVGAWRTVQRRSYFAVKLRPGWWLVALDSQLGSYIDEPQLAYFRRTLWPNLAEGDAIVLCTASPYWETTPYDADAFNSVFYFEKNFLRNRLADPTDPDSALVPTGAVVRLWLSGDHHHYGRFQQRTAADGEGPLTDDPRRTQLITNGLGGAYTMGVDRLTPTIQIPDPRSRMRPAAAEVVDFDAGPTRFPGPKLAARMHGLLASPFTKYWLPRRNPLFGTMTGLAVLALCGLEWAVYAIARSVHTRWTPSAQANRWWDIGVSIGVVLVLPVLVWAVGKLYTVFRQGAGGRVRGARARREQGIGLGTAALAYLGVLLVGGGLFAAAATDAWGLWPIAWVAIIAVGGGLVGSELFAVIVMLAPPSSIGDLKATGLAYEDGKGFLRMRLDPVADTLTVYPLVVDRTVHEWTLRSRGDGRTSIPEPADGLPTPRLIEEPIVISRAGF